MRKAIHKLDLNVKEGLVLLCGRKNKGLRIAVGGGVATCTQCLEKFFPGYYFKYVWDEKEQKYTYTILAKYGIMNVEYNSPVSEKKAPVIAKVDFIPSNGTFPAFIQELYVEPYFRRKGWGTFLIQQLQALNRPPIQLKSEPYQAPGEEVNRIRGEDLTAFYKKMGFIELPVGKNQMIWYPKSMLDKYQTICVRIKPFHFTAYVQDHSEISGFGKTYEEAIGSLISKHRDFFKISLVDVWN